jgi:hypothetical protein
MEATGSKIGPKSREKKAAIQAPNARGKTKNGL